MLYNGRLLDRRYRLDNHIASGGMGEVWRATDTVLSRTVAVKVLSAALAGEPGFGRRFLAEAQTMGALRHPGIVEVYDYGEDATEPAGEPLVYLVMEFVPGRTLAQWLLEDGRLSTAQTMSVLAQAADALHAVHQAGIVHRDVKPSNLLVDSDGRVRLADFGVARVPSSAGLTAAGDVVGTAFYMAPEQASGQPVTAAADVYALGAIGYHCLAGEPVFLGATALEVALQHVQATPRPLPPDVPPAAVELVLRAMAKSPADRYPSAAELARAAREIGDASGWQARAAVPATALPSMTNTIPAYDPAGRSPGRTAAVAALVVAALAAGGVALAVGLSQLDNPDTPPAFGPESATASPVSPVPQTVGATGSTRPSPAPQVTGSPAPVEESQPPPSPSVAPISPSLPPVSLPPLSPAGSGSPPPPAAD